MGDYYDDVYTAPIEYLKEERERQIWDVLEKLSINQFFSPDITMSLKDLTELLQHYFCIEYKKYFSLEKLEKLVTEMKLDIPANPEYVLELIKQKKKI